MTKLEIINKLELSPLEMEGGYFKEVYRSDLSIKKESLGEGFKAEKYTASTSIYYLLGKDDKSKMHAVSADETWHFYTTSDKGIYIELLLLYEDKSSEIIHLGSNISEGEMPQYTIKAGTMMGGKIATKSGMLNDDSWVLLGATVAPSFEYEDFTLGDSEILAKEYPERRKMILDLSSKVSQES